VSRTLHLFLVALVFIGAMLALPSAALADGCTSVEEQLRDRGEYAPNPTPCKQPDGGGSDTAVADGTEQPSSTAEPAGAVEQVRDRPDAPPNPVPEKETPVDSSADDAASAAVSQPAERAAPPAKKAKRTKATKRGSRRAKAVVVPSRRQAR